MALQNLEEEPTAQVTARTRVIWDLPHGLLALGLEVHPLHKAPHQGHRWQLGEVGGGAGGPTHSAHIPAFPPFPPSFPKSQQELTPITTAWEVCFQKVTNEKTLCLLVPTSSLINPSINLNFPGRGETGQETSPWAMPCLSGWGPETQGNAQGPGSGSWAWSPCLAGSSQSCWAVIQS